MYNLSVWSHEIHSIIDLLKPFQEIWLSTIWFFPNTNCDWRAKLAACTWPRLLFHWRRQKRLLKIVHCILDLFNNITEIFENLRGIFIRISSMRSLEGSFFRLNISIFRDEGFLRMLRIEWLKQSSLNRGCIL